MKPPDVVKLEMVRQWLLKAEEDLVAAKAFVGKPDMPIRIIGFHSQQSAEKYLKALLTWHQISFPKHHDLDALLDLLAQKEPGVVAGLRDIDSLTYFAVDARYPDDFPSNDIIETEEAVNLAKKVKNAVQTCLEKNGFK